MTNPKHTDTSRRDELEKCFNLGDCAWTVRQAVRGYVARHLAADRIEALEAEVERLREALLFYANNKNYRYIIGVDCTSVDIDAGDTARAALGEKQ